MKRIVSLAFLVIALANLVQAQSVPLEVFAGDKRTTLDLLLIKNLHGKVETKSKFLFFSRSRVSLDYNETKTSSLPQFSLTEALSYNIKGLKGFAPVAVLQVFNRGTFPKAGIQYLKLKPNFTFFSWSVIDLAKDPFVDVFILSRFTPKLTEKMKLYTQLELLNNLPTEGNANLNFVQRIRVGFKFDEVQFGLGLDLNETGKENFTNSTNAGVFLRYEF
ncbi:MAG: hypothetical protein ACKVOQ_14450 [Cyclobacteriaceae bacterium]